ncbi:carbon-nitrogen hydrolase family protein [Candidatus Poribacteria bacterium]|nr:carbon-nitrogen hydrolase family protein [Candidatus Poribacteria bacterium]
MPNVRIGMCQIRVEGGRPEENLSRAADAVASAARDGCDVALLPECLDIGWTHPAARELAQSIPGRHSDAIADAARRSGTYIVAGLVERAGDRLHNASILLSPTGELLLTHRKINELGIGLDLYSPGRSLAVADTPFGCVGIPICADNFPESLDIARALSRMGARLILSPCAWAVPPGFDNEATPYGGLWLGAYRTLASERGVAVVGVSNVGTMDAGPWQGHDCIGRSLAIGSDGATAAHLPFGVDAEVVGVVDVPVG